MAEDTSDESAESTESDESPSVHVDYRVFSVSIEGGDGDSIEDVNEIAEERIAEAKEDIEDLKRTDFELNDEYEAQGQAGPTRMSQ